MTEHPELSLSSYLDDALAPAERASVRVHLEGCASCRHRLDDLRATSRLLAGLPELVPTRPLRPRVQTGWVWLRPVRLLGSIGSGAFLFLFLASYVITSGTSLGGGTSTAESLAARGQFGPAASALAAEDAQKRAASAPTPAPAAAPVAVPQGSATSSTADTGRNVTGSAAPFAVATGAATSVRDTAPRQFGPSPAVFLSLALLCAIVAFAAHRRLRRSRQ